MPAISRRGRGGRAERTGGRNATSARGSTPRGEASSSLSQLSVTGWKGSKTTDERDGGVQATLNWLERKARANQDKTPHHGGIQKRSALRIRKTKVEGDRIMIHVPAEEAQYYTRLNNFSFAGSTITVQLMGSKGPINRRSPPPTASGQKNFSFRSRDNKTSLALKEVLARRYDADSKVLNLSGVIEDPEVKEVLSQPGNTPAKLWSVFAALCDDAWPTKEARSDGVTGLQLANNNLTSLNPARALVWEFPDLANLDLSNNKIAGVYHISHFRKFTKLEHVLLGGNPWVQDEDFKKDVLEAWPSLKFVDGAEITPHDREAAKENNKKVPFVLPPIYNDATGLGQRFFQHLFAGFDTDRPGLVNYYYDKNSTFSFSADNRSLREPGNNTKAPKGDWEQWLYASRNLLKINHASARKNRVHKGPQAILKAFEEIPPTQHPLDDPSKWLVECHPVDSLADPNGTTTGVPGLCMIIHGEFIENPAVSIKRKTRSFDRTIILGPGGANDDGIGVVSDLLIVRGYGGVKSFQPDPAAAAVAGNGVNGLAGAAAPLSEEELKTAMVQQVAAQTGMNAQWAMQCLNETGWRSVEAAVEGFQSVRANIPPEAFVTQ